ncbi:MAG: hypothetical protein M3472_07505, partial [Chloroflexota bacterium]|nr:hypothetical protein [Chloroflexota bacterium]
MKRSLILVAVAVLGVPAAAQGGQVTRMVDDDGRAAIGDCDAARETYREIESAIDDSGPRDRVLVCPGRYAAFDIHGESKDGLTVQAIERWRAIIYGIAPAEVVRGSFVTVREAEGVTIAGFHIRPGGVTCGYNAIFFLGATGVVRDNRIAPAATDPGCSSN